MSEILTIHNDGALVTATNYFETPHARQVQAVYVSVNAGCVRLLVPDPAMIDSAGAKYVIVTRGKWPEMGWRDALDVLFEDGTDSPFAAIVGAEAVDRLPPAGDSGRTDLRCIGYGPGLAVLWDLPARYRLVKRVPYREPWGLRGFPCRTKPTNPIPARTPIPS